MNTVAVEGGGTKVVEGQIRDFMNALPGRRNTHPILVISYETFRIHAKILHSAPVGLVLCDEVRFHNLDLTITYAEKEIHLANQITLITECIIFHKEK